MSGNYNEVTHNKLVDYSVLDPMYKWDSHFPDHITRLSINEEFHHNRSSSTKRKGGRGRQRNTNRYKTQPITFDEIKEVDEETGATKTDKEEKDGLKTQFTAFSRSMDGLVPGYSGLQRQAKHQPLRPSPLVAGQTTTLPTSESYVDNQQVLSIKVPQSKTSSMHQSPTKESTSDPANHKSETATAEELAAIGLTKLPDLPQDASRARRSKKRHQKKGIEEEPEADSTNNSAG